MTDIINIVLDFINKYGTAGILGCVLYIVYKIITASSTKWSEREQSYYTLLQNLGTWNNSLADRLSYFQEPDSWYRDDPTTQSFLENRIKGEAAYQNIRDHLSISIIFLSDNAKNSLEDLLSKHWYIAEHDAICTADYLNKTSKLIQTTYDILLLEAKNDFSRNRKLKFMQKLLAKNDS